MVIFEVFDLIIAISSMVILPLSFWWWRSFQVLNLPLSFHLAIFLVFDLIIFLSSMVIFSVFDLTIVISFMAIFAVFDLTFVFSLMVVFAFIMFILHPLCTFGHTPYIGTKNILFLNRTIQFQRSFFMTSFHNLKKMHYI